MPSGRAHTSSRASRYTTNGSSVPSARARPRKRYVPPLKWCQVPRKPARPSSSSGSSTQSSRFAVRSVTAATRYRRRPPRGSRASECRAAAEVSRGALVGCPFANVLHRERPERLLVNVPGLQDPLRSRVPLNLPKEQTTGNDPPYRVLATPVGVGDPYAPRETTGTASPSRTLLHELGHTPSTSDRSGQQDTSNDVVARTHLLCRVLKGRARPCARAEVPPRPGRDRRGGMGSEHLRARENDDASPRGSVGSLLVRCPGRNRGRQDDVATPRADQSARQHPLRVRALRRPPRTRASVSPGAGRPAHSQASDRSPWGDRPGSSHRPRLSQRGEPAWQPQRTRSSRRLRT